jgi:hypothetical protein
MPVINFQGLLNRPRIHNTRVHIKSPRQNLKGWTTKQEFPRPEMVASMVKYVDDFSKTKPAERDQAWNDPSIDGHIAIAFLNLPFEEEHPVPPPELTPFFAEVNGVAMLGDMSMVMPGGFLSGGVLPAGVFPAGMSPGGVFPGGVPPS